MTPDFQAFIKPAGSSCNLACDYCYYLGKGFPAGEGLGPGMSDELLEAIIVQHRDAADCPEVQFSWHGGEPTVPGVDYFRRIVEMQRRLIPPEKRVINGIQTNGTLLDEDWARFLAEENFLVGISLDGPRELHDRFRKTGDGRSSFPETFRGLELLREHGVVFEILCVVSAANARRPLEVYRYFKDLGAGFISFLPLVEPPGSPGFDNSVSAPAWGEFLCEIFDEWKREDIGRVKVQIFEETLRSAFKQEHTLCIFKETCGRVPVIERNGDFYSCDHYVDEDHRLGNILDTPLDELLEKPEQQAFGQAKQDTLPRYCRECEVLESCHGECPKNRFARTPDGEPGLNALCSGYRRFFRHSIPFVEQVAELWKDTYD